MAAEGGTLAGWGYTGNRSATVGVPVAIAPDAAPEAAPGTGPERSCWARRTPVVWAMR